jgi:predicted transposase YdaD
MSLPKELEQQFHQQISRYEEELRMPYITSIERMGIEQGIERGTKRGLLKGIELGLELKFGTEGLNLLSEIRDIQDLNLLEIILNQIKTANTLDQLRAVYQSPSQQKEN